MNISEKLRSGSTSLSELQSLAQDAKVHVNWLGSRCVTVDGYEGHAYINDFTSVYGEFFNQNLRTLQHPNPETPFPDFSIENRLAAYEFPDIADEMFEEGDKAIEESSFFTRILAIVQRYLGLFSYAGTDGFYRLDRGNLDPCTEEAFLYFTKEQFKAAFPGEEFPHSDSFIYPIEQNEMLENGHRLRVSPIWIKNHS